MDPLLVNCLSIQLVLAMLAPGIPFHGKTLFLADLWVFVVLGIIALRLRAGRVPLKTLGTIGVLFLVAFIHGSFRIPMPQALAEQLQYQSDRFDPGREAFIAFRFLSWLTEGILLWTALPQGPGKGADLHRRLFRVLAFVTLTAGGLTLLSGLSHPFSSWMASLYGYENSLHASVAKNWGGRAFGPFQSPLEAGVTLTLCGFLLYAAELSMPLRQSCLWVCGIAVLLTHTLTALASGVLAWIFFRMVRLKSGLKLASILGAAALSLAVLWSAKYVPWLNDFIVIKYGHLHGRILPWELLTSTVLSRWDLPLFGLGFNPIYVDNSYLFVFFKLGLLGVLVLGALCFRWGYRNWMQWSLPQRQVLLFLLISGLTLDTFIIRPVVMIFIAAGLPLLRSSGI